MPLVWLPCIRNILVDFTYQCLSVVESEGDASPKASRHDKVPTLLVREWAKATLASGSWRDALDATVGVSIVLPWSPL